MLAKEMQWEFSVSDLCAEADDIINEYGLKGGQISLTHRLGITDELEKLYDATGSLFDSKQKSFRACEEDFTEFNSAFHGTYLHHVYTSLGFVGRMRIMQMSGPSSYTVHRDFGKRYHIALSTNKKCFFVFPYENEVVHIPNNGLVYEVDTSKYHTFVNGSRESRVHIVMDRIR